jgi:SNF2 family DNA or RNA helicase
LLSDTDSNQNVPLPHQPTAPRRKVYSAKLDLSPDLTLSLFSIPELELGNDERHAVKELLTQLVDDGGEESEVKVSYISSGQWKEHSTNGVLFQGLDALRVLTELPEELENSGSDSLRGLVEITKFLLEILCKGQALPVLSESPSTDGLKLSIRWEVAFSNDSMREKFRTIASSLPPILTRTHLTPESYLQEFLQKSATLLCRTFTKSLTKEDPQYDGLRDGRLEKISEAFLLALEREFVDPPIVGNQLRRTLQEFQTWGRRYRLSSERPELTLHLKLREPKKGSEFWKLEPGLGVRLLPEKYLLASVLKEGETGVLGRYGYASVELDEMMLLMLTQQLEIFPLLSKTMSKEFASECNLLADEAYDFLTVRADELIKAGVVLDLPSWWQTSRSELSLSLKLSAQDASTAPQSAKPSTFGLAAIVDFEWNVALDGEELTQDEFELIVQTKKPLVFIRGRWVEINSKRMENTSRLLSPQKRKGQMRLVDALRQSNQLEEEGYLPVKRLQAEGWLAPLVNGETTSIPRRDQPKEFLGELREYQRQGLDWMKFLSDAGVGGCLADDMGLGKTVQFLALLLAEREEAVVNNETLLPTLLVVPMSILGNWVREVEKFAPSIKTLLHHGAERMMGGKFREEASKANLVLTTYALANRDEELLRGVDWHRVTLDEAQSIKNLNTKQSRSIRKLIDEQLTVIGRVRPVERLALTGTPLENHLEELFSIFDFLNPGYLGTLTEFRKSFSIPVERFKDRKRGEALSQMIRPLMLRRLKSDPAVITDLPEKIEIDEYVSLTPEQAALYQSILDELLPQVEEMKGIHRKGLILSVLTRLKQICNDPSLFLDEAQLKAGRSGKVERLKELLEVILDEGDVTLIFSQYAKMGGLLTKHLSEHFNQEVLFLHGSLTRNAREKLIERFNEETGPRIFVLSLKAGGYGLNLTRANQVIHFDQWWNPAVENQATDRVHRIGQKRTVQVRKLICQGTLEEKIAALSKDKKDLAEQIIGSTREYLTELSGKELRSLLSLSSSALREDVI